MEERLQHPSQLAQKLCAPSGWLPAAPETVPSHCCPPETDININSCIEELKVLLEFHKQGPNAKLEKADVLETTVVFLKRRLQPQSARSHGCSLCWTETLHFLSAGSLKEVTLPDLRCRDAGPTPTPSSHGHVQAAAKQLAAPDGAVWRPW